MARRTRKAPKAEPAALNTDERPDVKEYAKKIQQLRQRELERRQAEEA